ncbi:MAG TPA: PPOX class F420-dependent oxidoreductase [Actinomycetota bacterium]|nr:PPOX class F420-dependent oxidoreductase [Actinomycetota bacterium]
MSAFTEAELAYLQTEGLLARVGTVGEDGMPHVAPVGMWSQNAEFDAIDVTGMDFDQTKKFRDAARSGVAAVVIDDMVKLDPSEVQPGGWDSRPRGIEIRGRAEAITEPQPMIRIHPRRIVSWGLEGGMERNARDVAS